MKALPKLPVPPVISILEVLLNGIEKLYMKFSEKFSRLDKEDRQP